MPIARALVIDDPLSLLGPGLVVVGVSLGAVGVARWSGRRLNAAGQALGPMLGIALALLSVGWVVQACDVDTRVCLSQLVRFQQLWMLELTLLVATGTWALGAITRRSARLGSWATLAGAGVLLCEGLRTWLWAVAADVGPSLAWPCGVVGGAGLVLGVVACGAAWRWRVHGRAADTLRLLLTVVLVVAVWADVQLVSTALAEALTHPVR